MNKYLFFFSLLFSSSLLASPSLDISLDMAAISQTLTTEGTKLTHKSSATISSDHIRLPLPDGTHVDVKFTDYSVVEGGKSLSDTFRTWKVQAVDDPLITGVIDMSGNGFHAMLVMPDGKTVFIDPKNKSIDLYTSHFKTKTAKESFNCLAQGHVSPVTSNSNFAYRGARKIVTYRLALATTEYYTAFHRSAGRIVKDELLTMVTRLNVIYLRDLGIKFELVANNTSLIFTAANDPYGTNSIESLATKNKDILNSKIGEANYDIGHVVTRYAQNKTGVAVFATTCKVASNAHKAFGATGTISPIGDTFVIDFLAHEIGHQLGATHSFNSLQSSCNTREALTAYEPGSGSSIMGYAGICGSDNVQANSDAVFHIGSMEQINQYTRTGSGLSCGTKVNANNSDPEITAVTKGVVVRQGDSFTLTASATDADNNDLLYSWDQFDAGSSSSIDSDTGDNALYRVVLPNASPSRTFTGKATTKRDLTFKLVVRDGKGGIDTTITIVKVSSVATTNNGRLEAVVANSVPK
ncbi:MAG: hypothetical protein KAH22_11555, partial [Thiotrichaceae bacterium]|nr:hypothetical protein [Thiotrichaceae bacterium]